MPGQVFGLLGPNGAGKTTALRILSTVLKPTSGVALINGFDVVHQPEQIRRQIGFVSLNTAIYDRMTAWEMVYLFGRLNGISSESLHVRMDDLFERFQMNDFRQVLGGRMSTGMKQKVSICRTMIHDPEVVIFDEPTSGLDVITAENIIELIKECKIQGKTVIFSSHIMSEVDLLCDDLAIINKGKLLFQGTMEDYRNNMQAENLTAEFIRIVRNS
jgi:sodium transport system ATP-binding protein